jgi:hypothetical protein
MAPSWAGRSGSRLRYGILNNDHIAELLATRCCFSLRALRRLGSKLCSVQWKDLSRSCNTAFCGSGQAKDRGWEPHRASRNGSYPDTNGRVCSGAKASATRIKPQEIAAEQKNAWARLPRASLGYLNRRGQGISRRRAPRERGFMESRGGLRLDGENPCALRHTSVSNSGHRLTSRLTQWISHGQATGFYSC